MLASERAGPSFLPAHLYPLMSVSSKFGDKVQNALAVAAICMFRQLVGKLCIFGMNIDGGGAKVN